MGKKYYIHKDLCQFTGKTITNDKNFTCEMKCEKHKLLFEEINKHFYLQVLQRNKMIKNVLLVKMKVYK